MNNMNDWSDLEFFEDAFTCPICGRNDLVLPVGSKDSKVLIVAEFPGKDEIKIGKPMVGAMGGVLRTELAIAGIDMRQTRRTNLWRHPKNKNNGCLQNGIEEVIKEAQGKDIILLLGSDCVNTFLPGGSVTKLAGLKIKSKMLTAPIFVCPNPAWVFQRGRGVGEIRFALKKFGEYINETNN